MSMFTTLYDAHLTISGHAITWRRDHRQRLRPRVGRRWHAPAGLGVAGRHRRQRPAVHRLPLHRGRSASTAAPLLRSGRPSGLLHPRVGLRLVALAARNRRAGSGAPAVVAALGHRHGAAGVLVGWLRRRRRLLLRLPRDRRRLPGTVLVLPGRLVDLRRLDGRDLRDGPGWVDFWLLWIAVDLVGVPELLHFKFYPSAVLYGIYGVFVIWGFFTWLRVARTEAEPIGRPPRTARGARMSHRRHGRPGARRRTSSTRSSARSRTSPPGGPSSSSTTRTARTRATWSSRRPRRRRSCSAS